VQAVFLSLFISKTVQKTGGLVFSALRFLYGHSFSYHGVSTAMLDQAGALRFPAWVPVNRPQAV
jgi:hypothetical protein